MGSAIAQELALRHPELVRSLVLVSTYARPDALWRSQVNFWRWLPELAPSERLLRGVLHLARPDGYITVFRRRETPRSACMRSR